MQQPTQISPGCCEFCREQLYQNNDPFAFTERIEIKRWLCCGKGFHSSCWEKETLAKGGSLEDHAKLQRSHRCPLCNAHTASFKKTGKIIKSLKKWAKKKKSWAVTDLALMTIDGDGVPQNVPKGIKMLEKDIALGDANAMAILGGVFYTKLNNGKELEPEQNQQMMEVLTRAASLNHPEALTFLGEMYWNGTGVNVCKDKAIEYTNRAAKLNNHGAIKNLKVFKREEEATKTKPNPKTNNPTTTTKQCAHCTTPLDPNIKTTGCPCKAVNYCGTKCQRAHWRSHKQEHKRLMKAIKTKAAAAAATIRVPADCKTLKEAVARVDKDHHLTTILVSKGIHAVETNANGANYLVVRSSMNIIGDPDVSNNEIIILGGFAIMPKIQGNVHLQNMTVRHLSKMGGGVLGGSSFTMEDVIAEKCGGFGVSATGTGVVGRCTNIEVRDCGGGGVCAFDGASITLIGAKTTVHDNCTIENSAYYGLKVVGPSSTIQLVPPLTKETVAINNGGGGNYGAIDGANINQIKTMPSASPVPPGETKTSLPIEPDEPCFACANTLPKDHCEIMRFMCCGRGMHYPCLEKTFKHLTEEYRKTHDPKCPCCNKMYPTEGTDKEWAVLKEWATKDKELAWPYFIMAFRIKAGYFKDASFHSQSLIKDNYEKAALLGNVVGMVNLGAMYGNGRHGVVQDLVKARKWWGHAAALDDETAICCLEKLDKKREVSTASVKQAPPPPPPVAQEKKEKKKKTSTYDPNKKYKPNAKCHCGSGNKYKKCCRVLDQLLRGTDGSEALCVASNQGDVNAVNALLAAGVDVNCKNAEGWTPLVFACFVDRVKVVNVLLARKEIQINQAANNGGTPLYAACENGLVKVITALLARKEIQINQAANDGATPLATACQNDHVKIVNLLLARKEIQINQAHNNGATPLYIACQNDRVKVVNRLLARKEIQINQAKNDGATPLYIACQNDRVKVVNKLLARKEIQINQAANNGGTPLYAACQKGHVKVVNALLARKEIQINQGNNNGPTPLFMACQEDHMKVVNALLARKEIQINQAKNDGATPLLIACQKGLVKVVNALLARKEIQINQATNDGCTPLLMACCNGHVKVVKALLANKEIDINKDWKGETPLACAIKKGHTEIAALLQQHGAK